MIDGMMSTPEKLNMEEYGDIFSISCPFTEKRWI